MLDFDPERVTRNVQEAASEDLLDRMTVYRDGMKPEAIHIIAEELKRRGIPIGGVKVIDPLPKPPITLDEIASLS